MDDCIGMLKSIRKTELDIQCNIEHIERIHRIMKIPYRSEENARKICEKLALLEDELNRLIDKAVDQKREALVYLSSLSGDERSVLYQHYILAKDWHLIAEQMFISERNVFNLRKRALDKLSERGSSAKGRL